MKHTCKVKKQDEEKKRDILNRLILLEEKNKQLENELRQIKTARQKIKQIMV
jgi:hypothetical protein